MELDQIKALEPWARLEAAAQKLFDSYNRDLDELHKRLEACENVNRELQVRLALAEKKLGP